MWAMNSAASSLFWGQGQNQKLLSEYLNKMYWRNESHIFLTPDNEFEGMITGVDEIGRLCVSTKDGTHVFGVKEVQFLH
jgi:BirA family biotin operon repressor/biotin-[acetyl-CoA-carboxylase] ligase